MTASDRAGVGDFLEFTVAPGMRLFIAPTVHFKRTRINLFVHDQLDPERVALGALLPFIQKRGTVNHPTGEDLEKAAASLYDATLSGGVHKIGDRQVLSYSLDMPGDRFLPKPALKSGLDLFSEMIYEPVREGEGFVRDFVEQEKRFQVGRVGSLVNDKIRYAFFRAMEEMFKGEPFSEYELGSVKQIEKANPTTLMGHHNELLTSRPIDIYVVGDVDPDTVKKHIEETLVRRHASGTTDQTEGMIGIPPTDVRLGEGEVRSVTQKENMNQGWLVIGMRSDVRRSDHDRYGLLFLNGLLGGFAHSKLFVNVREKASLAYSAFSFYDSNKGILSAVAGIDVRKKDKALDIMHKQIEDVAAGNFTDEDLEATRRALLMQYRVRRDSTGGLILHHLGGLTENCPETIDDVLSKVEKVSRKDIMSAAERIRTDIVFFLEGTQE